MLNCHTFRSHSILHFQTRRHSVVEVIIAPDEFPGNPPDYVSSDRAITDMVRIGVCVRKPFQASLASISVATFAGFHRLIIKANSIEL